MTANTVQNARLVNPGPRHGPFQFRVLLLMASLCSVCSTGSDVPGSLEESTVSAQIPALEETLEERLKRAEELEPETTRTLQRLAAELGCELRGLGQRLKSASSAERKMALRAIEPYELYDLLRYTLVIKDHPEGRYRSLVIGSLQRLEALGFSVTTVKNYWPPEDDYSGVNAVLSTPDGFPWELQFHTPESLAAKQENHTLYTRARLDSTPDPERARLHLQMREIWKQVPIPHNILGRAKLHPLEIEVQRPVP